MTSRQHFAKRPTKLRRTNRWKGDVAPGITSARRARKMTADEVLEGVAFRIPVRTQSSANLREFWAVKARRLKAERIAAAVSWRAAGSPRPPEFPCVVTFVRVAPRALDGDDNLNITMKAIRDEIAATVFGLDDRDARVGWRYEQRRGAPGEYAVDVRWETRAEFNRREIARLEAENEGAA